MDTTLKIAIVAAISALITAVMTNFLAPHINWGIEKKKLKLTSRKELYNNWQRLLHSIAPVQQDEEQIHQWVVDTGKFPMSFKNKLFDYYEYHSLRPYLSQETLKKIDACGDDYYSPSVDEAFKSIQNDVDRVRKEWELD